MSPGLIGGAPFLGLGDGKMAFQYAVEHFEPCLFLLIQLYIPYRETFSLNT